MTTVADISRWLRKFAPPELAEDWDNVGLLVGDPASSCRRVMTCLTVTPRSAAEAIHRDADLIVAHHPMPFRPLHRLTTETTVGRLLVDLIAARIAVHSPHTAFDSAPRGINQRLAEGLRLRGIQPLVADSPGGSAGRVGWLDEILSLSQLAERLKAFLDIERCQVVGSLERQVRTVAVACGAAGEFLAEAQRQACDAMVLGETTFHTCLEAEASDVALLLPGHFASERFALLVLAELLREEFSDLEVWASREEEDPIGWC